METITITYKDVDLDVEYEYRAEDKSVGFDSQVSIYSVIVNEVDITSLLSHIINDIESEVLIKHEEQNG